MKTLTLSRVQSQLTLAAVALTGTAMGFENKASAAIINTFANANLTIPATALGIYINLQTGDTGTNPASVSGWDFNPYLGSSGLGFYWRPGSQAGGVTTNATAYADLPFGSVVGPASSFTAAIQATAPNYRDSGVSYLGFRFRNLLGDLNYGYAAIRTSASNGFPATILGWVFEDSGAPITVQQVPTPGAAGLLGLLAAGATTRRSVRRK
jgi:hypothetical protein